MRSFMKNKRGRLKRRIIVEDVAAIVTNQRKPPAEDNRKTAKTSPTDNTEKVTAQ